ncbi:effector-associated domain EAD1-containing protein [Nocardiopsis algeriensis]|uniref:effector-associated domain EAD1-containing protein n=1 Tax=Nocardiopsis algeriensis TaxID=1478215 RepID=UPI003B43AD7E
MDAHLTPEEIGELTRIFPPHRAHHLLNRAGFPPGAVPAFPYTARDFWEQVAAELSHGAVSDGRWRLLEAAHRLYPGNEVFRAARTAPPALPMRVLVMSAEPRGTQHLEAGREVRAITHALRGSGAEVELVPAARSTDLGRVLSFEPHVLHLVCHGEGDSLVFGDVHGEAHHVPARDLADTLRHYRKTSDTGLHGLVLSSCDGEHIAPLFTGAAEVVVAHRGRLDAACAAAFSGHLYERLAQVGDLGRAAATAAHHVRLTDASCAPVADGLLVLRQG